ncbi:hypothetical protein VPH35_086963 [Triticum aestivum]|uniref:uncharacterized protein n=1 Tax=Triticum aestivum TaxID=4565 RepID=UPI000843FE67|nr:uncharacterized protein LOC123105965 [Triticum aestivum]
MAAIKIKLVVDRSSNRVLLADAGSDFVDVILGFLMLPLSAVQLAAGSSSPGCLANLCGSVDRLRDAQLLKVDACHGTLHRPTHKDEFGCHRSLCSACTSSVEKHIGQQRHRRSCTQCWEIAMARLVHVYNQTPRKEVFSNWKERFVISDDLVIKHASTSNVVSFLRGLGADFGIRDGYEEVDVDVGWTEVVSLLKTCISSTTIFTDVFLAKGNGQAVRTVLAKRSLLAELLPTIPKPSYQETGDPTVFGSHPQVLIKLFYDRKDRKVMYAECKHEFVDLLLSFLTYPMGCIVKNLADTSHLCGSFNNLCRSIVGLDRAGFLTGPCFRDIKRLLDPSLDPFKIGRSFGKDKRSCHSCHPEFVRNHTYVVDNDLRMYQASAVSVLKHWHKRDLVEMDIAISKQEAVALLRAVVNSKTALTDAFKGRFMQEAQQLPPLPPLERRMGSPSVEKMQIFVRIFAGETITLDVASSDTVAAVRSKIQARKKLTDSCGLVYGGKCLQDPWTLADCGIHREATIHAEFFHRG